ncbi:MAG: LLM class flavin-dependent oxidoreductase [Acidimicrobiales bacterium]
MTLAEVAHGVEAAGVGVLWLPEGGPDTLDPVPLAGSLCGSTATLGIGIAYSPSRGRHPSVISRDISTVDRLSDGRAAVGVFEGGHAEVDLARLSEAVEVMHLLLTEEEVTVRGSFYEVAELTLRPRPVRPGGPPLVAGLVAGRSHDEPVEAAGMSAGADAFVIYGKPADVEASRRRLDARDGEASKRSLLWRGAVPKSAQAAGQLARSMSDAGADGMMFTLDPAGVSGAGFHRDAIGPVLESLASLAGPFGS